MVGLENELIIAQITDIHIGFDKHPDGIELNEKRFQASLSYLKSLPQAPDFLFLTGDITESGDADSYRKVIANLENAPFKIFPLIGNHDNREEFRKAFPSCPNAGEYIQYTVEKAGLRVIVLDTHEPGLHGGAFCKDRQKWLKSQLQSHPSCPTIIFMHHPPILSGIDWMDPVDDENWIRGFAEIIEGHKQILAINCGHLHRQLFTNFKGIPLLVSGSIAPALTLDFEKVDPEKPDGRNLVSEEPPMVTLHRWKDGVFTSYCQPIGEWQTLANYDAKLQPMMRVIFKEKSFN